MEIRLIASLKRNLKRHRAEEADYGFQWPAWQAEKLRNLDSFRKQNREIMAEYTPIIDEELPRLLNEQYQEGARQAERDISESPSFFPVNKRRVDGLVEDVNRQLSVAESASLRLMDDVYRSTVFRAEMAAAAGAVTMEQAVDMAVKDFLAAGINCVQYRNGRMVNIATYAEMAVRTASLRSFLRGEADRRAQLGIDTVLVSQYGACSETCLPWQGKVYIDDVWGVFDGERTADRGKSRNGQWFPLLSEAVASGLFHPNCRHTMSTWIEGVSKKPKPLDAAAVRRNAELEKRQRRLESKVRRLKRLEEGTMDSDQAKTYRMKRLAAQAELKEYVRQHGDVLRRDYWREKTHGIPDGAQMVAKPAQSGILEERDIYAINQYKSARSYRINAGLRGEAPLSDEDIAMIRDIDRAIQKLPVYEGIVYRSLRSEDMVDVDEFFAAHIPGKLITYPAYTSCSSEMYDESMGIQLIIQSRRGRDMRVYNPLEQEVLFQRDSRFIVTKREENILWLTEI